MTAATAATAAGRGAGAAARAVTFLTPLPLPGRAGGGLDAGALTWFPLVGAAIGLSSGWAWRAARRLGLGPLGAAAVAVLADVAGTGALHLDGLADTADGLFAHGSPGAALTRSDRLSIMAAPDVGAYGALALAGAAALRLAALAELEAPVAFLAATSCASRSLMALAARHLPYARKDGLATDLSLRGATPGTASTAGPEPGGCSREDAEPRRFRGDAQSRPFRGDAPGGFDVPTLAAAAGLGAALVVAAAALGRRGAAALVAGTAAASGVLELGRRRLGGFTGDVLGASGVVLECVALLAASGPRVRGRRVPGSGTAADLTHGPRRGIRGSAGLHREPR